MSDSSSGRLLSETQLEEIAKRLAHSNEAGMARFAHTSERDIAALLSHVEAQRNEIEAGDAIDADYRASIANLEAEVAGLRSRLETAEAAESFAAHCAKCRKPVTVTRTVCCGFTGFNLDD